ncbi:hypothetical protein AMK59_4662 [Oryctes borbonicus]|uniref:Uncharacterized protein n=1 Tax=Oryctes borbonicus TaxID=1629725 RepID=A0A0T6B8J4_9SCAR|nr:hypothetical protein AMK59_4662 [Oryctes borbonicus]
MALLKGKHSERPSDAIMLSKEDAVIYQLKVMRGWEDKSDTFAFRYGGAFLASISAATGIYINNHYRMKFKLHYYGRMSSYLPIVALPATLSLLFHTQFVTTEVTLPDKCIACIETRASAIQAMVGCVFPLILGPMAAIPLAMQYNTYDVPYITKEPLKVFKLVQKMTRPIGNILMTIFLGQAIVASIVTYFEAKSVLRVQRKLAMLEDELEHRRV